MDVTTKTLSQPVCPQQRHMQFGSDCTRMLAKHHNSKAVLVGHSMGGVTALHILHSLGPDAPILAVVTIAAPLSAPLLPATPTTLHVYAEAQKAIFNPHHGVERRATHTTPRIIAMFLVVYHMLCMVSRCVHTVNRPVYRPLPKQPCQPCNTRDLHQTQHLLDPQSCRCAVGGPTGRSKAAHAPHQPAHAACVMTGHCGSLPRWLGCGLRPTTKPACGAISWCHA